MQRTYSTHARSMALEAGSAMHKVFAAVRCWQLEYIQKLPKHANITGKRLFGPSIWKKIRAAQADTDPGSRDHLQSTAFAALHNSGFYDDPSDSMRTISNMELATIKYCDERLPLMDTWEIYVSDRKNPNSVVGIEQTFDIIIEYVDGSRIRYIGTIDGLVYAHHHNKHFLDENKTAARLDEGWRQAFEVSHQITGYCAATTTVYGFPIFDGHIIGTKIKPTNYGDDSWSFEVHRSPEDIGHWANWVRRTVDEYELYQDDIENATRRTHSCNRYFRPCALIPFCADSAEGREAQWLEMVPIEPSPSELAVMDMYRM